MMYFLLDKVQKTVSYHCHCMYDNGQKDFDKNLMKKMRERN